MADVLFISETKLKQESIFNDNIDGKNLSSIINECQDIYILPLLGTALYNDLQSKVSDLVNNGTPLSDAYKTLLDSYILPCLKTYIKAEAPYELNYKFTNKNVGQKNSEFSQPVGTEELKQLMQFFKNKSEFYAERLKKYLHANQQAYPLYYQYGTTLDAIAPTGTTYTTGMYLGDDCGCGEWINGKYYKSGKDR